MPVNQAYPRKPGLVRPDWISPEPKLEFTGVEEDNDFDRDDMDEQEVIPFRDDR